MQNPPTLVIRILIPTIHSHFLHSAKMSVDNTEIIALDCESVGVEKSGTYTTFRHPNKFSNLARVSIVNQKEECIYDKYVKPTQEVKDYR